MMTKTQLLLATALSALALGAAPAFAKNVVTMNTVQIFGTIDPAKISDYTDYMASVNLYDALVTVNAKGEIVPQLAESWTVSDDAKEVIYKIRDDAKFSDGSPVEATDVVYSVERLLKINQGPANLFAGVLKAGSVVAVDAKTVKFTLEKTFAPFLATVPAIMILNADVVKANEGTDDGQTWLADNVAGARADKRVSWDRGAARVNERTPPAPRTAQRRPPPPAPPSWAAGIAAPRWSSSAMPTTMVAGARSRSTKSAGSSPMTKRP